MKPSKTSTGKFIAYSLLLGAFTFSKICLERIEMKKSESGRDEKALRRRLTLTTLIYHAIGIFYNE